MNILKSVVFGIIEGITEWLPISSTAHMNILNCFLPLEVSEEFYSVFEVVIQLGAILAALLVYWNKLWPFGKAKHPLGEGVLSYVSKGKFVLLMKLALACIPLIVYKLVFDDYVNFVTAENEMTIIGISLILVGIMFLVVEFYIRDKKPKIEKGRYITYLIAFIIGLSQIPAAILPGFSRSGATIITALLFGISRPIATEFTFELAVPVMLGASLMEVLEFGLAFSFIEILILLVGCISAFITSLFVIRFILAYIKNNTFTIFGIYRVLMGVIILVFLR